MSNSKTRDRIEVAASRAARLKLEMDAERQAQAAKTSRLRELRLASEARELNEAGDEEVTPAAAPAKAARRSKG